MADNKSTADILMEFMDNNVDPKDPVIISDSVITPDPEQGKVAGSTEPVIVDDKPVSDFWLGLDDKFFKSGKLMPFLKEGSEIENDFDYPRNYDDLDAVIQANIAQKIEESKYKDQESLLNDVFGKTTPAFQFLAQHANNFSTPEELLPLIQSVKAQDEIASLDIENVQHQEYIIRQGMALQGFTEEAINSEIQELTTDNKLKKWAENYKPSLDKIQADKTEAILQHNLDNVNSQKAFMNSFLGSLQADLLDAPDLDGMNLSDADRLRVAYNLFPEQGEGAPLYTKIDDLFGTKDIKKLALISMIIEDKDGMFDSYYSNKTHTKAGKELARKLATGVVSNSSEEDFIDTTPNKTQEVTSHYGNFL